MAGGEKAKKSGEYGEAIVGNLIKLFGWENATQGVSVPCTFNDKHGSGGKKRETHGIDYVFQYKSPLRDSTRQDILISVKCRDGYPKADIGIKNKFKEFLVDLAFSIECFPSCELASHKISHTTKKQTHGLIFWIDRSTADGREFESVTDKIENFILKEDCTYDVISLIDNQRAQFLYSLLTFAKKEYSNQTIEYFYINTGLNNSSLNRIYSGTIMPVEYVNSDVIPLAISCDNDNKRLFLGIRDNFNKEYLLRLIGLAQDLTSTWTANVVIAFPDYNTFEHGDDVQNAKRDFENSSFVNKIEVISYNPDFRSEV